MRSMPLLSGVAIVGLIIACGRQGAVGTQVNQVTLTLTCDNDGGKIGVHPWRVRSKTTEAIKWHLASGSKSVTIAPKDPSHWPFTSPEPIVVSGDVTSNDFKPVNPPDTVFKYSITGICTRSNRQDTVALDPDMIIPN
jgi:hypothetical protein